MLLEEVGRGGPKIAYGDMPLGLVAMATESFHKPIMRKMVNLHFSISSEVM